MQSMNQLHGQISQNTKIKRGNSSSRRLSTKQVRKSHDNKFGVKAKVTTIQSQAEGHHLNSHFEHKTPSKAAKFNENFKINA